MRVRASTDLEAHVAEAGAAMLAGLLELERDFPKVYGSPRREHNTAPLHERWNYVKQAIGYLLWQVGMPV